MNNHIKRLLLSLLVGVGMIWALLGLFTLSPVAAEEVHCDEGSFFDKLQAQCRTEDDKASSFSALTWLENIGTEEDITPEQALEAAYGRAIDAEAYEFSAVSEQTLIPRARPEMIGQTQQRVNMQVSGEVTLPDYSLLSISLDGPGLDPTPVAIVQEGLKSFLLREGEKVPVENPAGLTSPTGDYLSYLAAAVNVQPCELVAAPFETAVACYTYDIDGQAYADHVQLQLQAQMARTAGAAPLGIEVSAPALLEQVSGEGKVWLDENGLPLRQKVDMRMPEADDYYDADVRMVIDYTFDETAVAAVQAAVAADASFLPTPAEVVESAAASLPNILVLVLFLTIAVLLIALRRRRWMYSFFAISITVIMLGTPILQIINAELFLAHRAYAAGGAETLTDTFVADEESAAERPSTTPASQTLMAQAMSPLAQAYQPEAYCGSGSNSDRDGDTLADDAEYCLGTNPNLADSDGDGINDGAEVAGFEYGQTISHTWYSDPTSMDTNQDGVSDGLEWAQSANGLAHNWDLDQDGIPNLYDTDDDGDGVGDERDISPASFTKYFSATQSLPKPPLVPFLPPLFFPIFNLNPEPVTATETVTAPVGLNITGQYNGYVYVDLQVQPQDLDHLRFGITPLDWGYDNKGQIQEHNSAVDEDISLIPMLVVESNVAPNEDLAGDYNVTPYKDIDGDGYGELMMPLYRVGSAGIIEAFHAHMAYGPDELAALDEEGVHWRNAQIVWMVRGQFDKESEDGNRSQQELTIHTYEEPATRITGWEVTKSGAFESAIFGTPQFPNDDRALFQLAFGLHQIYLENPQVDLDEINARFSGANTPIVDKWGITTTLAIDLPLEAYAHSDAGVADINNRIKSFLSDHYAFDSLNTVLVAYESHLGEANLDDFGGMDMQFSGNINLNSISMRTQRNLQLNVRDGWDPISNGEMALEVMKRVQPAAKTAMADLGAIYPDMTETELVSFVQTIYTTWEAGRTKILSLDGMPFTSEPKTDQEVYERIYLTPRDRYHNPEIISTLPGYLIEVGHIAQKGGGLMLASGHTWLYLQSNADEAIILGINLATTSFLEKANAAIKAGLNGAESFDGTIPWSEVELAAGDAFFGKDEFNMAKNAIGNVASITGLVDKGMTFASAAAEVIESSSKVAKFLSKGAKFMKSFGTVMGAAALALDIGLAVTMFFLSGDFSAKAIAMLIAQIVVAVVLFVLGTIPPWIGTVITVVLAIFDLILSFCDACSEFLGISSISGWLTENLADYFYREVQLTELQDYSFLERNNSLADEEMGFVVGNRFVITDTFQGAIKVSGKPGINWSRVKNAAIVGGGTGAIFALADQFDLVGRIFGGPSDKENLQNSWICGQFVITNKVSSYGNNCPDKTADYELNTIPGNAEYWIYENPMDVTVPLNTAQHDFLIQLSTKIMAQTRWDASAPIPPIIGGIPLGRVHWTKERKLTLPDDMNNDQKKQWQITPIYIDVLPSTVEGLWDWSRTEPILLNHDPDGDGMSTKDEVNNYLGLNAYTNLKNYFNNELRPDSPGDLDRILANWDYLEAISFNEMNGYCTAYPLHAHICDLNSSPPWLVWDFDQDGLSDKFEYDNNGTLGTNAYKYDTDGDGLSDGFEQRIGTRIDKKDSDADGLTDDVEVFHPTSDGSWDGGWDIVLPKYGAVGPSGRYTINVRVFSDPLSKDTDGDGLSDYAEKENGTSPKAYNRVPRVILNAQPTAVSPQGISAVYVKPGDLVTMTSRVEVYPPYIVSSTMSLDIPYAAFGFPETTALNGSRWVPKTGVTYQPRWDFSNNILQPWEYLYASTTSYVPYISNSTEVTAMLRLPYGAEGQNQEDTQLFVIDVENPEFRWMTPSEGELIGGGVTHYVVGGTSGDATTWVDELTLTMPGETVEIADAETFSPWAYTWELPSDGIYTLRGSSHDFVGHTSSQDQVEVMVDNTAPTVDTNLQDGEVYGPPQDSEVITITLNGTAAENLSGLTRVQISTDGGPWREVWTLDTATEDNTTFTDFTGNFSHRATAATWDAVWTLPNVETVQGYHSLRVRAFDLAGNWPTYLEREIIIDVLPPTDDLVNNAYVYDFPHLAADEPHSFDGIANDVGNVPAPSRPIELAGEVDGMDDATIMLGLGNIHENDGGVNVAWVGDFNGDRRGDLVVGLPAAADGNGRVSIIYGRSGNWAVPDEQEMLATADSSFIGAVGAGVGAHIMPVGDVNGDGHADLMIGDPSNNRVFLIFGRPISFGSDKPLDGLQGANWSVLVPPAGQNIGSVLGAAGDVNGDGFADIFIGATGSSDVGYLILGQANPWFPQVPIATMASAKLQNGGSAALTGLGDLDGNFYDEFAVGVNNNLYIFAGRSSYAPQAGSYTYLSSATVTIGSADATPQAVALGDVDGDHIDDFIYSNGTSQVLHYGDATLDDSWNTQTYNYGSGYLAAPGDVDGDGLNDILIGNGTDAYLISSGDVGSAQATILGVSAAATTPYAAGADLNSDGSSDLLFVPEAAGSLAAAEASTDSIADLPPTWVPQLPEQSLETFTGATAWPSEGANAYVNADGVCHGLTPCYATIQAAVDSHNNGSTIFIQPGIYTPFIIDGDIRSYNGLTVRGMDSDAVIIDGNGGSYGIRVDNAISVNLENMTVRNAGYGVQLDRAGINGHEILGNRTEMKYMLIYDTGSHDIYMSRESTVSVINSTLSRSSNHVGAYGAADPNIVVEWNSMAGSDWPIYDGGGAVTVGDYIYVSRGGGNNTFGRYDIASNTWPDPWGPQNDYEDNSVIAAGSDDQVYLLGAPHWRNSNLAAWYDGNFTGGGNGVMYAEANYLAYYWDGNDWVQIPGSPEDVYMMAAHPVTGDLYVFDYILDQVLKWDGSTWTTVIDIPFYFSDANDMAISADGTVYFSGEFVNVFRGEYNPTCSGQVIYASASSTTFQCYDYGEGASVSTIAAHPQYDTIYVGGEFETAWGDKNLTAINGSITGVAGRVHDIDVDEEGIVYVAGTFTSTLNFWGDAIDQSTPASIASWDGNNWTAYPAVIEGDDRINESAAGIAAIGGGEFYAYGGWNDFPGDTSYRFVHWDGSGWEVGNIYNESNNPAIWSMASSAQGLFISGHITSIEIGDESVSTAGDLERTVILQSPFEVYSTTLNSWHTGLVGPPVWLGDGASMAGDDYGNLVVLAGGGRTDSFKYDIETGEWSRVDGMNDPVNASAMAKGEDGYVYAVTDGPSSLYRFTGYWWESVGPAMSGVTLDDGVTMAYDSHFGTYYVLPGGNGTAMLRYNPSWGSSWEMLPADRNTPAGVRPGAGLVFVEGEDENRLYTAQGNYIGDTSTAFWMYPLPMPNKVQFTDSIIYAQNGTNWLNLSDPLPEDFNFRVDANSRFFGGSGWTPTNMGTLTTTTDTPFLDASRDLYRMSESGASYTIGYHSYTEPVTATTDTGIQAMINTGANRVVVQPGIYEEDVYLVNGVELIGTNPDWTVIKPLNGSTADALVRAMGSNGASLSRFTLDGENSGLDGFAATQADNLTLQRARIYDTDTAVSLSGSDSDVEIAHVTAANNVNGLAATNCASIDVRNSIFAYHTGVGLSHEACAATKLHTYNLYWANADDFGAAADAGAAELFLDPSFVDPMDHDYRTLNFSPVIDAGNPTDPAPPGAGSRADIGYIEQGRVNFYVDDSYCEICINDGLTWQVDAFDNIQDALDAAEHAISNLNPTLSAVPQLVVGVAPGTYNEQVSVPSHVLLFGSGAEQTTVDAGGSGTAVTFDGVSQSGLHHFTVMNADVGVAVTGASNMVDIQRNIIRNNVVGVAVNGRATGELEFNTLAYNQTGVLVEEPSSWIALMHNIVSGPATGLVAANFGQIFTDYNLYYNSTDMVSVEAGTNDMLGVNPLYAGGDTPYRLSETSPALDAANAEATVPDGGGNRADLGYSELLAAPVTLILGQEDLSTVMGNSGVASVEYSIVSVPDPTSEVTATLPSAWSPITLETPGDTFSYWSLEHTPTEEGFYRFYSRASDMVGNQEDDEMDWYDGSFVVDNTPPIVTWLSPLSGSSLNAPVELRAQVSDYAAGSFSVDENDVYFELDGQRYPASWAAEPWDESASEPRIFRAWVDAPIASYTNVVAGAEDKAGNVGTDNGMSFDITAVSPADTTPPTITVALPLPGSFVTHTVVFSGSATDADSGIASAELSLDGGATWEPMVISGTTWSYTLEGPEGLPMVSYPAVVRTTDRAGLNATGSFEFTIDEVAPTGFIPVTFNYAEESHFDTIPDLEIGWEPAIDASGTVSTFLTVDQITDTIAIDPVSGVTAVRSLDSSGDWYVHLSAIDMTGNMKMLHFGPWHVGLTDGAFASRSQSIIIDGYVDVAANEWRLDSEYLDDDERTYGSEVTYSPGGQQSFLTTWDANHTYLAWRGSHWALDGELWVYLKAGGSGSSEMIVPLASAPDATLPFDANYAIRITDPLSGTLYEYNGGWQVSTEEWSFANGSSGDTEIRLPLFGTSNVETLAFGLGDDHKVWAIFPTTNPLNPGTNLSQQGQLMMSSMVSAAAMQTNGASGWQSYQWADVTAVADVATNQPQAAGLALNLRSLQAPQADWGPGSTLQYIIEVVNLETNIISGQAISMTATAGALVHDDIEGATCSATNPWQCTLDPLAPGMNTITLTAHLAADLSGINAVTLVAALDTANLVPELITQDSMTHFVDGTPPTVTVNSAPFVGLGSTTFTGTADDGDGVGVDYVEVRPEFGSWQRVDGTDLWTVDLTVSPFAQHGDTWQFEVRAVDQHGLVSESQVVTFTVDLEGPAVSFDPSDALSGSTNDLTGAIVDAPTSSEAARVQVQLDDEPWRDAILFDLNEATGEQPFLWTWNMPTEDGVTHTLHVQAVDLVGNSGSLSPAQQVWVDNVSPVLTVTEVLTEVAVQHYYPGAQSGDPVLTGSVTDGTEVAAVSVWVEKPNGTNYLDTAVLNGSTWEYTPGVETLGTYKLQVRTWDTLGNQAQTSYYLLEVMAAPDSGPNNFLTLEDTPITIEPLLDDVDIDSDTIFIDDVADPLHGSATISGTSEIVYTPDANFNGVEPFTYVASDGQFTDTATVTVTVLPVNDPPVINGNNPVNAAINEDGTIPFSFSVTNVDDETLSWQIVEEIDTAVVSSTYGTGNVNADVVYTPQPDFFGNAGFTVRVSDGEYDDEVTVNVTVIGSEDAPRAADDYVVIVVGESGSPVTLDVMGNDVEVDGQTLLLDGVGTPSAGGLAQVSGGQIIYTPTLALGETETVSYTVSDGVLTDTAVIHTVAVAGDASGRSGETMVVPSFGANDSIDLTIEIPANVGNGDDQVTLVLQETAVTDDPPSGYKFAGLSFTLNAYVDGVLTSPYALAHPITLEIEYSDEDVADIGKGDDELVLYYWSGSEWLEDGITIVERDTTNNRLVVTVNHLTEFALFGKDVMNVFLPFVIKP